MRVDDGVLVLLVTKPEPFDIHMIDHHPLLLGTSNDTGLSGGANFLPKAHTRVADKNYESLMVIGKFG